MNVNECPIFVSSSDAYSDLWHPFFALLKREWPEYRGRIYLNTQGKQFAFPGLDIVCTNVPGRMYFGKTFKAGLTKVDGEALLLIMIDYFFESKVDVVQLQRLYDAFLVNDLDSLTLARQNSPGALPVPGNPECWQAVAPGGEVAFSFQTAFWKKTSLARMIADWETPWSAEFYGCRRFNILHPQIWFLANGVKKPIPYDEAGVLHGGGRWLERAVAKIDFSGIDFDLEASRKRRGVYVERHLPRPIQIAINLRMIHRRLMSRWSLFRLRIRRKRG